MVLEHIQTHIQWLPGDFSSQAKRPERKAVQFIPPNAEVRNDVTTPPIAPTPYISSTLYTLTETRKAKNIMGNTKKNTSFCMTAPATETIKQHFYLFSVLFSFKQQHLLFCTDKRKRRQLAHSTSILTSYIPGMKNYNFLRNLLLKKILGMHSGPEHLKSWPKFRFQLDLYL
jgi:hypothetical protein